MIAFWIALALLAVIVGLGFYLARFSMTGKRQTLEQAWPGRRSAKTWAST